MSESTVKAHAKIRMVPVSGQFCDEKHTIREGRKGKKGAG